MNELLVNVQLIYKYLFSLVSTGRRMQILYDFKLKANSIESNTFLMPVST